MCGRYNKLKATYIFHRILSYWLSPYANSRRKRYSFGLAKDRNEFKLGFTDGMRLNRPYIFVVKILTGLIFHIYFTAQYSSYAITLVAWAYFRLYYLAVLLHSLVVDTTTSFIFPCEGSWKDASCARGMYMEMSVYVLLIGSLWVLHLLWFRKMIRKGYKLIVGGESAHK